VPYYNMANQADQPRSRRKQWSPSQEALWILRKVYALGTKRHVVKGLGVAAPITSGKTMKNYVKHVTTFLKWAKDEGLPLPSDLADGSRKWKRLPEQWIRAGQAAGWSPYTIRIRVAALKKYEHAMHVAMGKPTLGWLDGFDLHKEAPRHLRDIRRGTNGKDKSAYTPDEVRRLIEAAKEHWEKDARARDAWKRIALMVGLGLRNFELDETLLVRSITIDPNATWLATLPSRDGNREIAMPLPEGFGAVVRLKGKGGRWRDVPVANKWIPVIQDVIQDRDEQERVFERGCSEHAIRNILKKSCADALITYRSQHHLRKTYALEIYHYIRQHTIYARDVAEALGDNRAGDLFARKIAMSACGHSRIQVGYHYIPAQVRPGSKTPETTSPARVPPQRSRQTPAPLHAPPPLHTPPPPRDHKVDHEAVDEPRDDLNLSRRERVLREPMTPLVVRYYESLTPEQRELFHHWWHKDPIDGTPLQSLPWDRDVGKHLSVHQMRFQGDTMGYDYWDEDAKPRRRSSNWRMGYSPQR